MAEENKKVDGEIVKSLPSKEPESIDKILTDVSPALTDEQKKKLKAKFSSVVCVSRTYSQSILHAGPLPPPSDFAEYEKVLNGSANRILSMAENQASHRQDIEDKIINSNCFCQKLGVVSASIITLVAIIGSIILIYKGRNTAGLVVMLGALGSLVSVFIYGKSKQKKELEEKDQAIKTNPKTQNP